MSTEYYIKNKRGNLVYIHTGWNKNAKNGNHISLFVSMCGYGPLGRRSRMLYKKSLEQLEQELSLFWKHPERKDGLKDLTVERYSHRTGKRTTLSMKGVLRKVEEKILIEKLKGR